MIRKAVVVLSVLALLACGRKPAASPPAAAPTPVRDREQDNLLNLARGASVVSRTAEMHLVASAVNAIDGTETMAWVSSPGGPDQTLVFALAAPSRIRQLGVVTTIDKASAPSRVRFSASADGRSWREVLALDTHAGAEPQRAAVTPFIAQYVRVATEHPGASLSALASVQVIGEEVRAAQPRVATGCWSINGFDAQLLQQGARVVGTIATPTPTYLEGGTDGRVLRFMWLRGAAFGYALATLTPDSSGLSGQAFFEELDYKNLADAWFGTRCDRPLHSESSPVGALFARTKRWPLYGLAFDAQGRLDPQASRSTLDAVAGLIARQPSHRYRVVAHEPFGGNPEQNRRHSVVRMEGLRAALQVRGVDFAHIELVADGGDSGGGEIVSDVQRLLLDSVTLERVQ